MSYASDDLQQRVDTVEAEIARLQLRVEQQTINVNELLLHPQEARHARSTLDRWVGELVALRQLRLSLYQQLAFGARTPRHHARVSSVG